MRYFVPNRKSKCVDIENIRKILIISNPKVGDLIITTPLIKILALSGYDVYVASCHIGSLDLLKYNNNVKGIFSYNEPLWNFLYKKQELTNQTFDAIIDLSLPRATPLVNTIFCSFLKTNLLIGFNKSSMKSYNVSIANYEIDKHVTYQLKKIANTLSLNVNENDNFDYDLPVSNKEIIKVNNFLKQLKTKNDIKIILLNPFSSGVYKNLSNNQIDEIYNLIIKKYPEGKVVLIGEPNQLALINNQAMHCFHSDSILDIIPLVQLCDLVVTIDTLIVHIASAFDKKTIAIYLQSKKNLNTKDIMKSDYKKYKTDLDDILLDGKYLTSYKQEHNIYPPIQIEHLVWAPNNPNITQLIVEGRYMNDVKIGLLIPLVSNALDSISSTDSSHF